MLPKSLCLLEVEGETSQLIDSYLSNVCGKAIILQKPHQDGQGSSVDTHGVGAFTLSLGADPISLKQTVELGYRFPILSDPVELLFKVGFHLILLFAEAVGLFFTRNPEVKTASICS